MSSNEEDVMGLCSYLAEEHQLKVTIKEAAKGAAVTGACVTVGGLLLGPIGIGIGAAVGGISYAIARRGKFKSVPEILKTLTPQQQKALCKDILKELGKLAWKNKKHLIGLVMGDNPLKKKVISKITKFAEQAVKSK